MVAAGPFLDDAYEFLRAMRGRPNEEVAASFGALLTNADSQRRELVVQAMLSLSSAVAVASERKLADAAAVVADDRASERFELAMLYLLEAAMAKGTIRPLDAEFARLIARGERNWR